MWANCTPRGIKNSWWHGVALTAEVCALPGSWGQLRLLPPSSPVLWEVRGGLKAKVKVMSRSSALYMQRGQREGVFVFWFLVI